jgi:hypothetical protein
MDIVPQGGLSLLSRFVELRQEVYERLNLKAGDYNVGYIDEENELNLMSSDDDLHEFLDTSISQSGQQLDCDTACAEYPVTNLNP